MIGHEHRETQHLIFEKKITEFCPDEHDNIYDMFHSEYNSENVVQD